MATLPKIQLQPAKKPVEIEIGIGQAQIGAFDIYLYDPTGRNPVKIGEGVNTDLEADVFTICANPTAKTVKARKCSPEDLDRHILYWRIEVASPSGLPGERYATVAIIRQQGAAVNGGLFPREGLLDGNVVRVIQMARLVVQSS